MESNVNRLGVQIVNVTATPLTRMCHIVVIFNVSYCLIETMFVFSELLSKLEAHFRLMCDQIEHGVDGKLIDIHSSLSLLTKNVQIRSFRYTVDSTVQQTQYKIKRHKQQPERWQWWRIVIIGKTLDDERSSRSCVSASSRSICQSRSEGISGNLLFLLLLNNQIKIKSKTKRYFWLDIWCSHQIKVFLLKCFSSRLIRFKNSKAHRRLSISHKLDSISNEGDEI